MSAENIVAEMPPLRWRQLGFAHCSSASYDFAHDQASRLYPNVDGEGHDWTGRRSIVVKVRLHFLNTMFGDTTEQYPTNWNIWRPALFDGKPGLLQHPDLGEFDAVVLDGHVEIVAQTRSGVVVDVTFAEHVEDPEISFQFAKASADPGAAAAGADAAIKHFLQPYPDGMAETDFFEAWASIKGQVFSIGVSLNGMVNRLQGHVTSMINDVESLNDPSTNPLTSALLGFWGSLQDFKKNAERLTARTTATRTLTADTTLTAFATLVGNTLNEIMGLNLQALKTPTVPKGTTLRYYNGTSVKSPIG